MSKSDNENSRNGLKWTTYEDRFLFREFLRGDTVEAIAKRHLRTNLAIRSRIIKSGLADPILERIQIFSPPTGKPLLTPSDIGIGLPPQKLFPRNQIAWTKKEFELLCNSFTEGYSIEVIAQCHRRHWLSVLCRIYNNYNDTDCFEQKCTSDDESSLRYERIQGIYDFISGHNINSPGYYSVEEIQNQLQREDYNEWLGEPESFDENEHEDTVTYNDEQTGTKWQDDWGDIGDDFTPEIWENIMGGPEDSVIESYAEDHSDDLDNEHSSLNHSHNSLSISKPDESNHPDDKSGSVYKNFELFFVQSGYKGTKLGAIAKLQENGFYKLEAIFGHDMESLPINIKNHLYNSISELNNELDAIRIECND